MGGCYGKWLDKMWYDKGLLSVVAHSIATLVPVGEERCVRAGGLARARVCVSFLPSLILFFCTPSR